MRVQIVRSHVRSLPVRCATHIMQRLDAAPQVRDAGRSGVAGVSRMPAGRDGRVPRAVGRNTPNAAMLVGGVPAGTVWAITPAKAGIRPHRCPGAKAPPASRRAVPDRSISASSDSSVRLTSASPARMSSASLRFSAIISSMRSSTVSVVKNLCTSTLRRWPMRKARSVACSPPPGSTPEGGRAAHAPPHHNSLSRVRRRRNGEARPPLLKQPTGFGSVTDTPSASQIGRLFHLSLEGQVRERERPQPHLDVLPPCRGRQKATWS